MSKYSRPNPDVWNVTDTVFEYPYSDGQFRIELWEFDTQQQWVLVVSDGKATHTEEHAPLTDSMVAMMFRVMNNEK